MGNKNKRASDDVAQDIQRFERYMHTALQERGLSVSTMDGFYAIPYEAEILKNKDSSITIAAFLAAWLPMLQREATSKSPSWEFTQIYGLACSVVPNESAIKRIKSIWQAETGKARKGKLSQFNLAISRICIKAKSFSLADVLNFIEEFEGENISDLYESLSDPIDVKRLEVDRDKKKVFYRLRNDKEKEITFKTLKNTLANLKKLHNPG